MKKEPTNGRAVSEQPPPNAKAAEAAAASELGKKLKEIKDNPADVVINIREKKPDLNDDNWIAMLMDLQLKEKRIRQLEERCNSLEGSFGNVLLEMKQTRDQMTIHLKSKYGGGSTS